MLLDFKLPSYSNQNSMILGERQTDQVEQNQKSRNKHTYGQLIYDKCVKNIQWRKDNLFSKWCWENWTATFQRMKIDHYITPYTKKLTQNGLRT